MGRVNTPTLADSQRQELERGLREVTSHCFRMRCQSILLKSDGTQSKEVGHITGMCAASVNSWLKRYKVEGLSGLSTKSGRGRKSILTEEDKPTILLAIKANRQRMRTAKAAWEAESGKKVGDTTFTYSLQIRFFILHLYCQIFNITSMKIPNLLLLDDELSIEDHSGVFRYSLNEIVSIVCEKPYVIITTNDNRMMIYLSLSKIFRYLNENFIRCNKSTIVNILHVKSYCKQEGLILLKTGEKYIVSIRKRTDMKEKLSFLHNV